VEAHARTEGAEKRILRERSARLAAEDKLYSKEREFAALEVHVIPRRLTSRLTRILFPASQVELMNAQNSFKEGGSDLSPNSLTKSALKAQNPIYNGLAKDTRLEERMDAMQLELEESRAQHAAEEARRDKAEKVGTEFRHYY